MTVVSETLAIVEASISELSDGLDRGLISSVELVALHLNRIAFYDRHGIRLNAVPVLNPGLFNEARAADQRRRRGKKLGPLDGIPYLAKDSYAVRGLSLAAGSPAYERLVAGDDAFVIARLRAAGAILVGLTNMPPLAAGGMQRGVYGRAESPYNADFLTAAFASGSSNGSGTGVAASLAVFGLAEETWSSGRAPASNNGLVAYTPSRGVISVRGNWPLIPTMDVVVPYTRCLSDLFHVLNVIVADDPQSRGDFWRVQKAVNLPAASAVRPDDYHTLADPHALTGKRVGVPRMYINKDSRATHPIATRPAVIQLWEQAARDLTALGAEVVEVDFPLVSNYEGDRPGTRTMLERGLVPQGFAQAEGGQLIPFAWHDFLVANGDPNMDSLAAVDGKQLMPSIPGTLRDRYEGLPDFREFPALAPAELKPPHEIEHLEAGLQGLDKMRALDLDQWMETQGLDLLAFPAVADVAPADADHNPNSNDIAWRNGTWVANGNQAIRHYGVPTVSVPMGMMADIRMPVGLTFAGRAYDDNQLLAYAYAFEQFLQRRVAPPRTPPLAAELLSRTAREPATTDASDSLSLTLEAGIEPVADDGSVTITVRGTVKPGAGPASVTAFANGQPMAIQHSGNHFSGCYRVHQSIHTVLHSRWRGPYGTIITAIAKEGDGAVTGAFTVVGGIA